LVETPRRGVSTTRRGVSTPRRVSQRDICSSGGCLLGLLALVPPSSGISDPEFGPTQIPGLVVFAGFLHNPVEPALVAGGASPLSPGMAHNAIVTQPAHRTCDMFHNRWNFFCILWPQLNNRTEKANLSKGRGAKLRIYRGRGPAPPAMIAGLPKRV
jgi:hypothetical protein